MPTTIRIVNKSGHSLPTHATAGSAGLDLRAALEEPVTLEPLDRALIPTGLYFAIPAGYEVQIRPRSGLAMKHGITVLNTPGTIDSDYRGEIRVALINLSREPFTIEPGEILRLRNKGLPSVDDARRGDELISIQVHIPSRLSGDDRKLVEQMATRSAFHPTEADRKAHASKQRSRMEL